MDCVCCIYLPCFHVKHLCRSWWENLFHNSHFFGFCLKFLTGKTWEIGPRSNCHVDNSAATLQNLKILINLFHFDRISQFWPDFTILNKSQNFDQVSWFLVYFTITNLMIFWHDVLPQDFEIMGKAGKIVRLVRILISQHFANCSKSPREVSEIWNKFRHSESWTPTKNGFEDNESPISKGCSSRWEWWGWWGSSSWFDTSLGSSHSYTPSTRQSASPLMI